MKQNCNFKITLDKPYFITNEIISGKINLELLEPIDLKSIFMQFTKKFECEFDRPKNNSFPKKQCKISKVIYSKEIQIYESYKHLTKLGSGYHTFPFKIALKSSDSGSCVFSKYFNDVFIEARSFYVIDAFLKVEGIFKPVLTDSTDVEVVIYHQNKKKISDNISITSCLCITSNDLMVIGYTDREKYRTTDQIVFLSRLSTKAYKIKSVKLRLYCHIALKSNNNILNRTKLIASNDVSKMERNDCQAAIKIPAGTPATISEKYLYINYSLSAIININRTSPIMIERSVCIFKEPRRKDPFSSIGAFRGIKFPCVYISMD